MIADIRRKNNRMYRSEERFPGAHALGWFMAVISILISFSVYFSDNSMDMHFISGVNERNVL